MTKIIYIGADDFSAKILKELLARRNLDIVAVATYPDKPSSRGHKLFPTPVKMVAVESNLPIVEVYDVHDRKVHSELASFSAPLGVLVSFKIVPVEFLAVFPEGVINLHPSLLPDLRGAAPVQWAIMLGYKKSGLTTFVISEKVDCGKILMQDSFVIGDDETAGEVFEKIVSPGAELIEKSVAGYLSGKIVPRKQMPDGEHRAPKILRKHRIINWEWNAQKIHNRIRGLSPKPGAVSAFGKKMIKILRSKIPAQNFTADFKNPGEIVNVGKDEIIVSTGDGAIALIELQPEGRQKMTASEFARGYVKGDGKKFRTLQ
ncbi:methionyl-tRNA formyltransferase [bacterium]|nr:methionyl-tRNA formyltransferase [bacterium]